MKRILLIGAVNLGHPPAGGEEFKNQILYQKLEESFACRLIDTIHWKKNPSIILSLLISLFFRKTDSIIISASSLSSYRLIKILSFFPSLIKRTNYFVIGGYFPKGLNEGKYKSSYYKKLNKIVVEGEILKNEIVSNHSLLNIEVISNFKKFYFIPGPKETQKLPLKFVFISLITEDKGCDTIFNATRELNAKGFVNSFTVSFYGKIDLDYKEKFLTQIGNNCYYNGYLDIMQNPNESYLELSGYDCLLFPSYFKGEGFPGVLIDSFIAGLPTIASDWNMNTELVIHEKNGIVVPVKNEHELANAMQRIIESPELLNEMSINARNCANNYHIDSVWPSIQNIIEI